MAWVYCLSILYSHYLSLSSLYRENRYLLFLTENYAALDILKQYLKSQEGDPLFHGSCSEEASLTPWEMEPFILFGSSFPGDKEYTQVIITVLKQTPYFPVYTCRCVEISIRLRSAWRLVEL